MNKLDRIISEAERCASGKDHIIIAIDGRCASGKTTVAGAIAQRISCDVIHTDDFFLPPEKRTAERLASPGGNMDRERLRDEILIPLKNGREYTYSKFSCSDFSFSKGEKISPKSVTIVEGSYSCHPELWDYYDLHIFLSIDEETQRKRVTLRNKKNFQDFFDKWIPLEEKYFNEFDIRSKCEMNLDGDVDMEKAKVYFSRDITPETVIRLYEMLGKKLQGKIAVKLHSGEKGNQNFLRPEFWKPIIDEVDGTVVECNTAYDGARNYTEKHRQLISEHGWDKYFTVDLMDAEGPDLELPIPDGKVLKKNYVGKNIVNYDSMLVLAHFKGHPAGGYGGAIKQLSIGCASSKGKSLIHSAGFTDDQSIVWDHMAPQDLFLESMADAAKSVVEYFGGNIAYINVMKNLSVDCDCCAVAEDPCMKDIGILASSDPVAIDRACLDLIYAAVDDPGQKHFLERVESLHGAHTVDAAEALGCGSANYELIEI